MKKYQIIKNNEINLINLFRVFWYGKIKIILITIIFFLVGHVYVSRLPNSYLISLDITPSPRFEFTKVSYLLDSYKRYSVNNLEINELIFNRFKDELIDYHEFVKILAMSDVFKGKYEDLNKTNKEALLFKEASLLSLKNFEMDKPGFSLNLIWDDPIKGLRILDETVILVIKSLRENLLRELEENLEIKKKNEIKVDMERLRFLEEQATIAKELGINNNSLIEKTSLYIDRAAANIYYLRGAKAIDKEIEIIKNRDYQSYKFLEEEINSFKTQNINWVNYNINRAQIKLTKDTSIRVKLLFLGFFFGVFYVLTLNSDFYKNLNFFRRNN